MTTPWYATREQLARALDFKEVARNAGQLDRALASATLAIEGEFHRRFYPELATRFFDWPNRTYSRPWRLWLDGNELISATAITAGGDTIAPSDFFLRRMDDRDEPPYTHVEVNLATSATFAAGDTHQRAISIAGLYGYRNDEAPAGVLESAIGTTTATTVDVTNSATIGVGALLRIGAERMVVVGRQLLDTGQNLAGNLTAQANNTTVPVGSGAAFAADEVILIDGERMLIVDIAGNNLIVRRMWDGTTLAAHTNGADVFAPRRLTVARGVLGTTAAAHLDAAEVACWVPPGPVNAYALALAVNQVLQESAGYTRTVGSGENERESAGRGVKTARELAWGLYGRKARIGAI